MDYWARDFLVLCLFFVSAGVTPDCGRVVLLGLWRGCSFVAEVETSDLVGSSFQDFYGLFSLYAFLYWN